jgi:hypothetical protein
MGSSFASPGFGMSSFGIRHSGNLFLTYLYLAELILNQMQAGSLQRSRISPVFNGNIISFGF